MKCSILYTIPDADFWSRYAQLWERSLHRSAFQSPHIVQYFSGLIHDGLAVFECTDEDKLIATALFKRENGYYTFLSDLKTDANFFLLDRNCTPEMMRHIFEGFIGLIEQEKMTLMLNHFPAWAGYMGIIEDLLRASSLYSMQLDYSVCPVAAGETPEALYKEVSASRNTRYKVNKFVKQENGTFEVLTDDADMDHWADEFCDAHVARWAPTPTPSAYRDPKRREFLKNCLHAWYADKVLVRFALRVGEKRIGFMVGLLEEETLIYHAPTFHPDYAHCSPGRALIYFITQWMAENKLRILDFGDGNEPYKYYVASKDQVLRRIFISGKYNLSFIAKTRFIKAVREHQKIYSLYQNKLKPAYRNLLGKVSLLLSSTLSLGGLNLAICDENLLGLSLLPL